MFQIFICLVHNSSMGFGFMYIDFHLKCVGFIRIISDSEQ